MGFPGGTSGKEPACQCRRHERHAFRSLGWEDPQEEDPQEEDPQEEDPQEEDPQEEDPQEEGMAIPLAWRISWMEELCGLQSISLHRVRYN